MKKILFFLAIFLLLPQVSFGVVFIRTFTLNITKITTSGDGTFSFGSYSSNGSGFNLTPDQQASITTTSGQGTAKLSLVLQGSFRILEREQQGWNLSGAVCSSADSAIAFASVNAGVEFSNLHDGDVVNCTFTNAPPMAQKPPVLIVPGIMGTELFKQTSQQNEQLWPDISRMLNPFHDDSFMDPLADLSDTSLNIGKVIDKKPKLDYTQNLIDDLISQGYSTSTNLFLFPYDWRRDIYDVAVMDDPQMKNPSLKQTIDQIASSTGFSKIDVIAHSQGGLVVKSLLADPQYQNYRQKIGKLVFVGVPNLGSPKAAKALLYGDAMGVSFSGMGLDPAEVKNISQNMPAVYELLPGQQYFTHYNGYLGKAAPISNLGILHVDTLGFASTTQYLIDQHLNSGLVAASNAFHNSGFDNIDVSSGSNMKVYNIVGCRAGTPGKILIKPDGDYQIIPVAGDGTVPVFSADNIPGATTLYALESDHATMLTTDGIRQQIINIIAGVGLSTAGKITPNLSDCRFDGVALSSHSPVQLHVYDNSPTPRHVGPTPDGGFDYNIPNVGYDTLGHASFAFLPAGRSYTIKLVPTAEAKNQDFFNFYSTAVENGQMATTTYYDHVFITPASTAQVAYASGNNQPFSFTVNGGTILPSAVLDPDKSQDLTPPISTSTITGTMGQMGYYRSNVSIALSAQDPIVNNNASTTSGVLNIKYSLDNTATSTYQSAVAVTAEGQHTISFFSTDKAGNNEQVQTVSFAIDKTPPEAIIQFNPVLKDIQFTGTDNISTTSKVTVIDNINDILLTDQAGNTTDIKLKEKNRKVSMKSTIQSLSYNGTLQDVSKNILAFLWTYDKNNKLISLSQHVAAKKTYVILAVYNGKKTSLVGLDKTGIILKSITGLSLLKVTTNKGDLGWSY